MKLNSASYNELHDPFGLFKHVEHCVSPCTLTDGALILWGGEDIGTEIYNQKPSIKKEEFIELNINLTKNIKKPIKL